MYNVLFIDSAKKDLRKLNKEEQERVISVLERIKIRPHSFAMRLSGSRACRVRAGKLRIIMDINDRVNGIVILKIGNRENVYLL